MLTRTTSRISLTNVYFPNRPGEEGPNGRPTAAVLSRFWSLARENLTLMTTLTIECDGCIMQGTDACSDCVVTFICGRAPEDAVVFDAAEERALGMLGRGGLVPPIRHHLGRQRAGRPG